VIYPETLERAAEIADKALEELRANEVPSNPQNFSIWYEYESGRNPALVNFVDRAREKGLKLTPASCRDIYDRFFTMAGGDPDGWSTRIQEAANQIIETLENAGQNAEHYEAALQDFSGNIQSAEGVGDLSRAVKDIVAETKTVDGQIRALQSKVEESRSEIVQLREELVATRREAMTDSLTGLANRKSFDEALMSMAAQAREEAEPLSLVLCDIDHFKRFNDTFGHQIGDQVLRLVGITLNEGTKGADLAARYGGEEFALILPNTYLRGGVALAENLRRTLSSRKLARKGSIKSFGAITMSFGVTEYLFNEPLEALVGRADQLLYQAKQNGRNRVVGSMDGKDTGLKRAM